MNRLGVMLGRITRTWPFPIIRFQKTDRNLTEIFLAFLAQPDLYLSAINDFHACVTCGLGTLRIWRSNGAFGWANSGEYHHIDGEKEEWERKQPSRYATRKMMKFVDQEIKAHEDRTSLKFGPYRSVDVALRFRKQFLDWAVENGYSTVTADHPNKTFSEETTEHAYRGFLAAKRIDYASKR